MESLNEFSNIFLDDRFLISHTRLAERVTQRPPKPRMVLLARNQNMRASRLGGVQLQVLLHLGFNSAVSVDIDPCLRRGER